MAISKRKRFEIFKRDRFACQYCGQRPPGVILELDHICPRSKGGGDEPINLVTSCRDCNQGKSNIDLAQRIPAVQQEVADAQERLDQVRAYNRLVKAERREQKKLIQDVAEALGEPFLSNPEARSVRLFLGKLPLEEVLEAADIAASRKRGAATIFKYFCGVCWKKIKGKESE